MPSEQAEALRLLIQKIEYDGPKDRVHLTFWPGGLRTLAQEQTV